MTYTVKFSHPHFPEDHVFGIEGLGRLTNDGTPVEVSEENEQAFRDAHDGVGIEEAFSEDPFVTVEGGSALSEPAKEPEINPDSVLANKAEEEEESQEATTPTFLQTTSSKPTTPSTTEDTEGSET